MELTVGRPRSSSLPPRLPSSRAHRCPALLISEEARDLICTYVAGFKSKALPTLASFALTTRRWTESGQRALYKAPLRCKPDQVTWRRANLLVTTLAQVKTLASYVRSLDELTEFASALEDIRSPPNRDHVHMYSTDFTAYQTSLTRYREDFEGDSSEEEEEEEPEWPDRPRDVRSWVQKMLRLCTRVTTSSVPISSDDTAEKMAARLNRSHPRLSSIRLASTSAYDIDGPTLKVFADCLTRSIKRLTLQGLEWEDDFEEFGEALDEEGLDLEMQELILEDVDLCWEYTRRLFPRSSHSPLKVFSISTWSPPEAEDLVAIIDDAANLHLETFRFKTLNSIEDMTIADYNDDHEGPQLLSTFFTATPYSLRRLILHSCEDMEANFLHLLVDACPLLEQLDLTDTTWSFNMDGHAALCTHWERLVVDALELFIKLSVVHLGWLPITLGDPLPLIETSAEKTGMVIAWRCCCGGFDDDEQTDEEQQSDSEDEETRRLQMRWRLEREMEDSDDSAYLGPDSDEDSWVDEEDDVDASDPE